MSTGVTPYVSIAVRSQTFSYIPKSRQYFNSSSRARRSAPRHLLACGVVHTSHVETFFRHGTQCLICSLSLLHESISDCSAHLLFLSSESTCLNVDTSPAFPTSPNLSSSIAVLSTSFTFPALIACETFLSFRGASHCFSLCLFLPTDVLSISLDIYSICNFRHRFLKSGSSNLSQSASFPLEFPAVMPRRSCRPSQTCPSSASNQSVQHLPSSSLSRANHQGSLR